MAVGAAAARRLEAREGSQAAARQGYGMLMLGATSCSNPTEMKALGYALGLHRGKDWWGWCLKNGCDRGRFGGLDFNNDAGTLKYLHDAIYEDREDRGDNTPWRAKGSRIRVKDLGDLFPETLIMADSYDVTDPASVNSAYETMADELKKLDAAKEDDDVDNALTVMLRARQEVEILKVPTLCWK